MLHTIEVAFAAVVGAAVGHVLVITVMAERPAHFDALDERLDHRSHASNRGPARGCPPATACPVASRRFRAIHRVDLRR